MSTETVGKVSWNGSPRRVIAPFIPMMKVYDKL